MHERRSDSDRSKARKRVLSLTVWLAAAVAPCASAAEPLAIRNVNVITMTSPEVLADRTVVIRDGVIDAIVPGSEVPAGVKSVDGRGKYLLPGLCDMHVHVADLEARTLDAQRIAAELETARSNLLVYLRYGITCMRNMSGSELDLELKRRIDAGELLGPRLTTTSPIVDGDPPVWPFAVKLTDPSHASELVSTFKAQGYDAIKVYNGLTRDSYFALTVAAREAGMNVVGHVPFSIGIWGALGAGQYSIEHFRGYDFNPAMAPGASSASNRFAWWFSLTDEDLRRLARATRQAGIFNTPTLNLMELAIDGPARDELAKRPQLQTLPPKMRATIANDTAVKLFSSEALKAMRDSLPIQQRLTKYMIEEGAPILAGTDAPALGSIPGDALLRELELIAASGVGSFEALRTATVNPARYYAREDSAGTLEVGKQADLLLLQGNPLENISNVRKIEGVFVRGEWHSAKDLLAAQRKLTK